MNQKGKRLLQVLIVIALACTQSGCGTQESGQREDLAFTVCADTELPDDLRRVIDEKKQQAFQVSYTTQDALYIAVGYGAHDRMNLQVIVEELYRTDRAIYVKTNLVTEEASSTDGAAAGTVIHATGSTAGAPSMYPYIVIRTEKISLPVHMLCLLRLFCHKILTAGIHIYKSIQSIFGGSMEFSKKEIHTSVLTQSKYSQITVDDDFTIPDSKGDMEKLIAKEGQIILESVTPEDGKVRVTGVVCVCVLYRTGGEIPKLARFCGEIPFEDAVSCDGATAASQADCHSQLEDLTVSMINSRKLEVRGLIGNNVHVYEETYADAAVGLETGENVECRYTDVTYSRVALAKRDVLKIREELEIPQNKPNIQEILWQCVALRNMETKAGDEKLLVRGEVEIFVLYKSGEERLPVQSLFSVRSLYRELPCAGASDGMVVDVDYALGKGDVTVRQDTDGEDRVIGCDYNVDMNIRLYEDCSCRTLADIYSPNAELVPNYEVVDYENLLLKNGAKAKVSAKKQVGGDKAKLLQICHVYGDVDIDDVTVGDDGVTVTGVVKCSVLYIATGDDPMSCVDADIPFSYVADTVPLAAEDSVRICPSIDQLSASLLNSEEIEIKAQINLNISIFAKGECRVMTDMQVMPIDEEKKAAQPGIVGYVVKKDENIWMIAKRYYASIEAIRELNHLESDDVEEGDRLLIVKN